MWLWFVCINDETGKCTIRDNGRIRPSVSTANRTYEPSRTTHMTSPRKHGKHSTGPSTYEPWVRTYSKLFSCKSVLTVCSYRAQPNEIHTCGRASRGSYSESSQSNTTITIVYLTVYSAQIKENTKAPRHWPLCGDFPDDRWIPRTNGQ